MPLSFKPASGSAIYNFDDVFRGLRSPTGNAKRRFTIRQAAASVTQRFDETFRECVVYTPPHREAICIEPLTCVPDCFDLAKQGIDAGLRCSAGRLITARWKLLVARRHRVLCHRQAACRL